MTIDATRDQRGPDNDLLWGPRLVRPGGRLKFSGIWFQDKALEFYEGERVYVDGTNLIGPHLPGIRESITVYGDYWQRKLICVIDNPNEFK